jgi:hypothetical protein
MNLSTMFLQTLLTVAPPGHTKFSLTTVDCGYACSGYKWSSFYNSYVQQESFEEGKIRYGIISESVIKTAQQMLCVDNDLNTISDCKRPNNFKGWRFVELVSITGGAMIAESGFRKDVEDGNGRSGKPSDDGGQGRGPGGEVCLLQIHPSVLAKHQIDPVSFLGEDNLDTCISFGMEMFSHARNVCAYRAIKTPEIKHNWIFETYSVYGTGYTCMSSNKGKTDYRTSLYHKISSDFGARIKKAQKKQATLPLPPP